MWFFVLAQVTTDPFWESPVGQAVMIVLTAMIIIATIAAGVAGVRSIIRSYSDGTAWTRAKWKERKRRDELLDQILSSSGWANGSKNIVEANKDLYAKVAEIGEQVEAVQKSLDAALKRPKLPG